MDRGRELKRTKPAPKPQKPNKSAPKPRQNHTKPAFKGHVSAFIFILPVFDIMA